MKTTLFILLTGLSLIVLISCQNRIHEDLSAVEKKAISGEIETIVRNFLNADSLSYRTEVELRANVDGYVAGGDGKILFNGYEDMDRYMKQVFSGIQKFTECEIPSLYVYVLSKEAAACTVQLKGKFLTTSGDTIVHNACWTFVFKKFDDKWKVIQENGTHTKD